MMNVVDVLPSIFISHGAPDILLSKHRAVAAMRELAGRIESGTLCVVGGGLGGGRYGSSRAAHSSQSYLRQSGYGLL